MRHRAQCCPRYVIGCYKNHESHTRSQTIGNCFQFPSFRHRVKAITREVEHCDMFYLAQMDIFRDIMMLSFFPFSFVNLRSFLWRGRHSSLSGFAVGPKLKIYHLDVEPRSKSRSRSMSKNPSTLGKTSTWCRNPSNDKMKGRLYSCDTLRNSVRLQTRGPEC